MLQGLQSRLDCNLKMDFHSGYKYNVLRLRIQSRIDLGLKTRNQIISTHQLSKHLARLFPNFRINETSCNVLTVHRK